ncbi:Aminotran-1-2 domain-containing protein [Mycena kentingensis (nom. inval.)]|nr:Aminotran-1-2 domain-containing protein [Mycena kentingensis (nom. inval.)]
MSISEKKPTAVDLSHHLSDFAKSLQIGFKFGAPAPEGTISLDGGVPDTEYFPIESLTVEYLKPSAFSLTPTDAVPHAPGLMGWISDVFTGKKTGTTNEYKISRRLQANDSTIYELKTALQYSATTGIPAMQKTVQEWVARVHKPAYSNFDTLIEPGASCAWSSVLQLLLNPGEAFLADRYAYNAALMQARARGLQPVAVSTDGDGLSAVDLERVLATWDETARGFKRPRVIYTQGGIQNPTGLLITAQRKKEIYDIAVRYDVIIVEDDPYFFQQASSPYKPNQPTPQPKRLTDEEWIDGLVPSFLRFDYEGRVVRLDTFSKTIGPGGRLGYYTGSPQLLEKLQAFHSAYTSFPSGLTQAIYGELVHQYQTEGFARWLRGLTAQYELRRNWALDALNKALDLRAEDQWSRAVVAYVPSGGQMGEKFRPAKSLMSFTPPDGGMFIWFNLHLHNHPRYHALARQTSAAAAKKTLAAEFLAGLREAGVVMRPGEMFAVDGDEERARLGEIDVFLRASYSSGTREDLEKAMGIFSHVLVRFFE